MYLSIIKEKHSLNTYYKNICITTSFNKEPSSCIQQNNYLKNTLRCILFYTVNRYKITLHNLTLIFLISCFFFT